MGEKQHRFILSQTALWLSACKIQTTHLPQNSVVVVVVLFYFILFALIKKKSSHKSSVGKTGHNSRLQYILELEIAIYIHKQEQRKNECMHAGLGS